MGGLAFFRLANGGGAGRGVSDGLRLLPWKGVTAGLDTDLSV